MSNNPCSPSSKLSENSIVLDKEYDQNNETNVNEKPEQIATVSEGIKLSTFIPVRIKKSDLQDKLINRVLPYIKFSPEESLYLKRKRKNSEFYLEDISSLPNITNNPFTNLMETPPKKEEILITNPNKESSLTNPSSWNINKTDISITNNKQCFRQYGYVPNCKLFGQIQNSSSNNINPYSQIIYSSFSPLEILGAIMFLKHLKCEPTNLEIKE